MSISKSYPTKKGLNPLLKPIPIVEWPNPILNTRCEPVTEVTDELKSFMVHINLIMALPRCAGIAAPQLSKNIRMCAVKTSSGNITMINPKIIIKSENDTFMSDEGCLSIPGFAASVMRYRKVIVEYKDTDMKTHTKEFIGYEASICQHEIDHLDGITLKDK